MKWYLKRTLQALLTVVIVINAAFFLIQLLPGGPKDYIIAQLYQGGASDLSRGEIAQLAQTYVNVNVNQPIYLQWVDYMSSVFLHGDFGRSVIYNQPVSQLLVDALPWTIFYASIGIVLTFVIGITLGSFMAYREGSWLDTGSTIYAILSGSIPYYVAALLFLFFLGYQLQWFPTRGRYADTTVPGLNLPFLVSALRHAALPIISTTVTGFGGWALGMRGNSIQELGKDYLRVARLRGLYPRRIATLYVGRNAILPLYTGFLIGISGIFGGSVILEQIFTYRGVGLILFKGIQARDYPLMMGGIIMLTTITIIMIYIADLSYGRLDPRVSDEGTRESYGSRNFLRNNPIKRLVSSAESNRRSEADHQSVEEYMDQFGAYIDHEYSGESASLTDRARNTTEEYVATPIRILLSDWRARLGSSIMVAFLFLGLVGPSLVPAPKGSVDDIYVAPFTNPQYPLGTTGSGEGIFALVTHATPEILKMVVAGAFFAMIVGSIVGILSGYVGGLTDRVLMIVTDTMMTIPGLPLVILLSFFIDLSNSYLIGIVLAINNWTGLARALRSQVLSLREESYVESSRIIGVSSVGIGVTDIVPNVIPYIAINFASAARGIIFESVALFYLGIIATGQPNWGVTINQAVSEGSLYSLTSLPWLLFPMGALILFSLSTILLAQGGDRVFNPRVRTRHSEHHTESDEAEAPSQPSMAD
ncbi:ABC transporter integral membrane protein [Halococcus morrhuae DSM 1307]|uniref:ABC transporter integral membrane protein n=1 Tax=Halococcus morrhuae DSM 1307 TaxID=931277 RepID=M0MQU2_HALMO|nr:ABC transporter permease subunit [Halococcus morrhuae]EMA46845.1 ABC transporter integral membrane protein [Halococcus morrhuae DSM 1307]